MENKGQHINNKNTIQAERLGGEEYNETWNMIEEMENIQKFDTDKAWDKMMNRFESEQLIPEQATPVKKLNNNRFYWMAASIALLIGFAVALNVNLNKKTQHFANNTGKVYEYSLADGTTIFLNNGAEINIAKGFNEENRQLHLKGEAFFDVARNENLPFEILVKDASIKVLGTSFNVRSFENSNNVEVVVKTGKVSLSQKYNPSNNIALTPNQKGVLQGNNLLKETCEKENYMAWKDKALEFKNASLVEVIEDINHAYQVDIKIDKAISDSLAITATYQQLTIEELIESICLTMNLSFEKQGETFKLEQR